jgi:hypothetical protein
MLTIGSLWLHKKSGGAYKIIAVAKIETGLTPSVVYQSLVHGDTWVRPEKEFLDGRFERVDPLDVFALMFESGAQAAREMIARFVEQGGDHTTANSIRLNWNPSWGPDPGMPEFVSPGPRPLAST